MPLCPSPSPSDAKAIIKDDAPAPGTVAFKVNAKYPESQPKPTMPTNLLLNLPTPPEPLEYQTARKRLARRRL